MWILLKIGMVFLKYLLTDNSIFNNILKFKFKDTADNIFCLITSLLHSLLTIVMLRLKGFDLIMNIKITGIDLMKFRLKIVLRWKKLYSR